MIFVKHPLHNPLHYLTCYQISYNLIINTTTSNMPHKMQWYSIQLYRYYTMKHIVTILISITYSYIYQYNLSIKIYNSQYRYKHTDSIIGMILNNTEMYIYTVYTYHNYTIINTILVYSNFSLVYHSYLLSKQWILKLYEKCITEYFSLPYDFTSWHENGATGLVRPLSGIIVVQLLYTI